MNIQHRTFNAQHRSIPVPGLMVDADLKKYGKSGAQGRIVVITDKARRH